MRLLQLLEDEPADQAEREEAHRVHQVVTEWLTRNENALEDLLIYAPSNGGSWVLPLRRAGLREYDDLIVIFNHGNRGVFGRLRDGRKAIILPILLRPGDLTYLHSRFSGRVRDFIHEFTHYLLARRSEAQGSAARHESGDLAGYYNTPHELNSYYQEAAHHLWRVMRGAARYEVPRRHFAAMSTPELVDYALEKHFDRGFVEALTPGNLRRIRKRLARFIEQTIRPLLG